MRTVQATEAKARLADLLRMVERGETVAITRHGETIAHVVPAPSGADHKQAVARFRRRRGEWQPVPMSVDDILHARHHGHRL